MEVIGDVMKAGESKEEYEREMAFLKKPCPYTGNSLHQHLCDIVHFSLATRAGAGDAAGLDAFEECSKMLRQRRAARGRRPHGKGDRYEYALRARRALLPQCEESRCEEDWGGDHAAVLDTLALLRRCGLGVDPEEGLAVALAVRRLAQARTLIRIRFWGKVMARGGDYTVLEAELTDDELDRRADLLGPADQAELEDVLNRKVYLVCSDPCGGGEWRELPPLRPAQVVAARGRDRCPALLSGRLDTHVRDFPGTEAHLLHAQVVRIAASCSVSPAGAYTRSPATSQDLAEDELGVVLDADWLGVPGSVSLAELADPGVAAWVHHAPCLLQSGRPADPDQREEGLSEDGAEQQEEEEEEEPEEEQDADDLDDALVEDRDSIQEGHEEEEEDGEETANELGVLEDESAEEVPALLTTLDQDAPLCPQQGAGSPAQWTPSWAVRVCSPLLLPAVLLRSLRWPGAFAFCSGRKFGYIYFGWAVKASAGACPNNCGEDFDDEPATVVAASSAP